MVIQGLGGRNKTDAPTATWEAAEAFLDRATAAGAPVYSMLIARPFDRPIVIDESNFHYLSVPVLGPHAEAAARASASPCCATRRPVPSCATPSSTTTAIPRRARPSRRRCGARSTSTRWRAPSTRSGSHARIRDIADELGVAPADALLDLALAEDLETRFRWRTESPEWAAAVREAQLDARMIVGTSDGGAHLARDDGADWSSYFLRSWVLDREVWTLEEGIRQITQVPAALLGLVDRGVLRPGAPADLFVFDPDTIGPWKKEFVHDLPGRCRPLQGLGPGRARHDRQRRADRVRRASSPGACRAT